MLNKLSDFWMKVLAEAQYFGRVISPKIKCVHFLIYSERFSPEYAGFMYYKANI